MSNELLAELVDEVRELRRTLEAPTRDDDRPLTRTEAAEYLGVHSDTLFRWAHENKVAYVRFGTGEKAQMRFLKKDLQSFVAGGRIAAVE